MPIRDSDGSIRRRIHEGYHEPTERVERQKLPNSEVPFSQLWLSAEPRTLDGSEFKGLWRGLVGDRTLLNLKPALRSWANLYDADQMGHVDDWEQLARGNAERTVSTTITRCIEALLREPRSPRLTPTQVSVCQQQLALAADLITTAARQPHSDRQCEIARVQVDDPEAVAILGGAAADGERVNAAQLNALGTLSSRREFDRTLLQGRADPLQRQSVPATPRVFVETLS